MDNDDQDHRKQGEGLKGDVTGRHMIKVEAIGDEEHGSQYAGKWMQLQKTLQKIVGGDKTDDYIDQHRPKHGQPWVDNPKKKLRQGKLEVLRIRKHRPASGKAGRVPLDGQSVYSLMEI